MDQANVTERSRSSAALGIVLIAVGIAVLALRQAGIDVIRLVDGVGWPFFIIVPGLLLLAMATVPAPPAGVGFAIGGSIVTTVGGLLLYQEAANHWQSWAYAWALIPGAAGLGTFAYGLIFRRRELVADGARLAGVAAALFVAGFWFFETVFDTGRAPIDLATWWPGIVIGLGLLIVLTNLGRQRGAVTSLLERDVAPLRGDRP
jgi:hypothetical protein